MTENPITSFTHAYGFTTYNQTVKFLLVRGTPLNEAIEGAHATIAIRWIQNISFVAGWCPLIGTIVGIFHLVLSAKQIINLKFNPVQDEDHLKKKTIAYWSGMILRSVVEILSFGYLLILPDLFMTCVRSSKRIELPKNA